MATNIANLEKTQGDLKAEARNLKLGGSKFYNATLRMIQRSELWDKVLGRC